MFVLNLYEFFKDRKAIESTVENERKSCKPEFSPFQTVKSYYTVK